MIRRSTWIVLAIFVVLVGVYWFFQRQNENQAQSTTPTPSSQPVFVSGFETIQAVQLEDSTGKIVAIEKDSQGNWNLTKPEAGPADQDQSSTMVSQVSNLRSLAIIGTPPPLDAVGLDTPAYTVTIKTVDGSQQVANIGTLTPTSSGYYVEAEGGPLMVVTKSAIEGLVAYLENPPFPPTPTVEPSPTAAEGTVEPTVTPTP
jgi:hypothetical protein